jgi:hypothetical protein
VTKEIRTAKIELGDPFAGQYLIIRTNPRMRVFRGLASGDLERMLEALASMSIESTIRDQDGTPIDVTSADGWAELDVDDLGYIADKMIEAMKAPKASANGSSTQSLPARGVSPANTST